jgi:hypothetical protein
MASEQLATIEPWTFRAPFSADTWFSDMLSRETETLTKALQKSISSNTTDSDLDSFLAETAPANPTISNVSGSDPEPAPKRPRLLIPAAVKKASKRKSRASKRSQTTYITADPAEFRQMVQRVTGFRFSNSQVTVAPIFKPEPHRASNRLATTGFGGGFLPTLDTSAFWLDHHQQNVMVGPAVNGPVPNVGPGLTTFQGNGDGGYGPLDFDGFCSFPTLESWKVM